MSSKITSQKVLMGNLIAIVLFCSCNVVYSQKSVFIPEEILVQDAFYAKDSSYGVHEEIKFPIIRSYENKLKDGDLFHYLIENALNGPLQTLKPEVDAVFPYSAIKNFETVEVKRHEEIEAVRDGQLIKALEEIDYLDISVGVSAIEIWKADIINGIFEKEVLGYEIITRETNYYTEEGMVLYNIPFRVIYPEGMKVKNPVLCAEVSYEFPLAPMAFYYGLANYNESNIYEQSHGYFDLPVKNYQGDNYRHAPLLSGLNKRNLIEAILNAVQEGKIPAYDFHTDEKLSKVEIETLCTRTDTIDVMDPGSNEIKETIVKEPHSLEDFNSLIFKEHWYIDRENGKLEKKVKEIALVKAHSAFEPETYEKIFKKEIAFKIKIAKD